MTGRTSPARGASRRAFACGGSLLRPRIKDLEACGQKSRFDAARALTRLPPARLAARLMAERAQTRQPVTGVDEVSSVSYLPAAFTTLFFLAAGLLLGLIR